MTRRPSDIIRRGVPFTGSKLLDAINAAGAVPFGGRRILVTSSGPQASIREAGHQIIPQKPVPAVLGAATSLAANRWEYAWKTAKLDPVTGNYVVTVPADSNYLSSTSVGQRKARNTFEQTNTASVVRGGEPVTIGTSTITIGAVAAGVPTLLYVAGVMQDTTTLRVFDEVNPVTGVTCS